jgi:hypothetical protein
MAVTGGYNILMAYNTLYRVGLDVSVGAPLLLVGHGSRSCDGDAAACQMRHDAGGWGPTTVGEGGEWIPNRNLYVYDNVFYDPSSARTMWSHFTVLGPITPPPNTNIPSPSASDANLRIRGNMIWNGPSDLPLGVGDTDQGCQASNPTCNPAQLVADNAVNLVEPRLLDPAHGNFRPYPSSSLLTVTTYAIPDFSWDDAPTTPGVPPGIFSNSVLNDRDGNMRAPAGPPGAYAVITQQQTTSSISTTSTMPTTNTAPTSLSTYSESTFATTPPPGIPGFPVEAIVLGLIVGFFMLSLRRVRKKS